MNQFAVYDEQGRILRTGTASESQIDFQAQDGEFLIRSNADPSYQYVLDGLVRNMPERPSPAHIFDYSMKAWVDVRTLDELKAEKWAEVRQARDAAEFGGFSWQGQVFDSDQISQGRITGAVQLAQLDPGFAIDWTLADNTVVQLDAAQMQVVGIALGSHVSAQHARARALREAIHAPGVTPEALAAITFSTEE